VEYGCVRTTVQSRLLACTIFGITAVSLWKASAFMLSSAISSQIMLPSSYPYSKPFFSGRMPLPPGINQSYRNVSVRRRNGRTYNRIAGTGVLNQFKENAEKELLAAHCDVEVIKAIWAAYLRKEYTPLVVSIRFYFAEMWQRDVDGGIKHVIDAAFDTMGLNDRLIVWIHDVTKAVNPADPHAEIDVCCLLSPDDEE
jgi:Holliday junction resolvase RusA-like endonuclease